MKQEFKYKIGHWIRFYQNGKLVIGIVQYIKFDPVFDEYPEYQTEIGAVREKDILEAK